MINESNVIPLFYQLLYFLLKFNLYLPCKLQLYEYVYPRENVSAGNPVLLEQYSFKEVFVRGFALGKLLMMTFATNLLAMLVQMNAFRATSN
jgi:hypothetical protein